MVTGGGSGLGLAVAERLVERGARVVVLDLRRPVALPPGAAYVEADVGSEAAADRAMAEAVDVLGGLTLAVNCAGISHRGRLVGRAGPMAQADFARVVSTLPPVPTSRRTSTRTGALASRHRTPNPQDSPLSPRQPPRPRSLRRRAPFRPPHHRPAPPTKHSPHCKTRVESPILFIVQDRRGNPC